LSSNGRRASRAFCVEHDVEHAGEGDANGHFLLAGFVETGPEVPEVLGVAGGDASDEEEDRADAGSVVAGASLALLLIGQGVTLLKVGRVLAISS
jgi:hypothetical protein